MTLPNHCSWLSLPRKLYLPNFFSSNSQSSGGGIPRESKFSWSVISHAAKIVHVDYTRLMVKRFFLVARNIPLMGILRNLHQFPKSKLESGTFLKLLFSYSIPIAEKRWEGGYVHPHSTSSQSQTLGIVCYQLRQSFRRSIKITDHFTCTSANVINCISCTLCKKVYIGETGRRLGDQFREHLRDVEKDDKNHI